MRMLNDHAKGIAARVAIGLLVKKDPLSWRIERAQALLERGNHRALGAIQSVLNTHPDLQTQWLSLIKIPTPDSTDKPRAGAEAPALSPQGKGRTSHRGTTNPS